MTSYFLKSVHQIQQAVVLPNNDDMVKVEPSIKMLEDLDAEREVFNKLQEAELQAAETGVRLPARKTMAVMRDVIMKST